MPRAYGTEKWEYEGLVAGPDSTVPICILVHGYGFDMDRSVEDARWAISRINAASSYRSMQCVLFHWPSELEHSIPWLLLPRDIRRKGDRADIAGHHLAWLINQLPPHQPVCIVGHSLGCRVAACALHLLGGGMTPENLKQLERAGTRVRIVSVAKKIGSNHNFRNYMASESIANLLVTAVPTLRPAVASMK